MSFVANTVWCTNLPLYFVYLVKHQQVSVSAAGYCSDQQADKKGTDCFNEEKEVPKGKGYGYETW